MTVDDLLVNLEYWADCLEDPTHNPLETGFRHSPLTKDEIIERYRQECYATRHAILSVMEIIKQEGLK
jgi:hypothetical protein